MVFLLSRATLGLLSAALATAVTLPLAAAEPEIKFGGMADAGAAREIAPANPAPAYDVGGALERDRRLAEPAPGAPASPLHPYINLQAGGSGASLDPLARANPGALPNTADPDRHYRAHAGIDYDLSPKTQLGFGYRYSNADRPALVLAPAPDTELEPQQRDQAAMFSLRYRFGADR